MTLLVGLVGAVVLAAFAGARRTDSAYTRLLDQLAASQVSVEVSPQYFDAISELPQVEEVAPASYMFVAPAGGEVEDPLPFAAVDERFTRTVDRPRLLDGRRPAINRVDEVLINTQFADESGAEVGSSITLASFTPDQMTQLIEGGDAGDPAGPLIDVSVVGIGRTQEELANRSAIIAFTPAFYAAYRDDVGHFDDILMVRLARGFDDVDAFRQEVARIVPEREGAIVESLAETSAQIEDAVGVQSASLVIFASVAALAGFVAVGQAFARHIARAADEREVLRVFGLARAQRFAALLAPVLIVAIAGAAVAVGGAALISPVFPSGFARKVEPDPGFALDWFVLGVGFAVTIGIGSASAALSAWRTSRRPIDTSATRPSARLAAAISQLDIAPPATIGVRMAVDAGRGSLAVPVRSALVGAIAGVAGLVAALTFGAALGWVVTDPEAYGEQWNASVVGPFDSEQLDNEVSALKHDDDVDSAVGLAVFPIRLDGEPIGSFWLERTAASSFVTTIQGRAPTGPDEVLVGSETLDRLGRRVGDTIAAAGLEGRTPRELRIVGRGVFPEFAHPAIEDSDTGAYNDFALLTDAGDSTLIEDAGGEYFSMILVRWTDGSDDAIASRRLERGGASLYPLVRPARFDNLSRVREFPAFVAAFVVLLAVVAMSHALAMSLRRRRRDLTLLRTIGFVGSQIRGTIAWQATTLAIIGIALGIPAGLLIGRGAWLIVARRLGIDEHVPVPWVAIVIGALATLLVANVIAAFPAARAARTRPAVALRAG